MGFLHLWLPHYSHGFNEAAASCHMVHTSRVHAAWQNRLTEVDCSYSKAMAAWTTMYKKLNTVEAARHISPRDPVVRSLPLRRLWIKPSCWGLSSTFSKRWWRQWRGVWGHAAPRKNLKTRYSMINSGAILGLSISHSHVFSKLRFEVYFCSNKFKWPSCLFCYIKHTRTSHTAHTVAM